MTGTTTDAVLELINGAIGNHRLMVAIDGMSAAGKSTLATSVVERLSDAALIRGDDFYRVMDNDERFALSDDQGFDQDFDWRRLRHEVLEPLRAGQTARFRRYHWPSGQLGEWAEIRPSAVVVAEGVYMSRPEFHDIFDLVVWVDTPADTRATRQSLRDDTPAWVARWDAAERYYVAYHRPADRADLVVPGHQRTFDDEGRGAPVQRRARKPRAARIRTSTQGQAHRVGACAVSAGNTGASEVSRRCRR